MKIVKLECTGCGAPLKLPEKHRVLRCPFCGVESVIVGLDNNVEDFDSKIMISPFTTKKTSCQKELLKWLSEGDFTPDDLLLKVKVQDIQGIYLPFWKISGSFSSTFSCSVGHSRREKEVFINEEGEKDIKTNSVVDWSSYSGTFGKDFVLLEYAFSNTSKDGEHVPSALHSLLKTYAKEETNYRLLDADIMDSVFSESLMLDFDVSADDVLKKSKSTLRNNAIEEGKDTIPADRHKNFNLTSFDIKEKNFEKQLFPAWIVKFAYGDSAYCVGLNGTDITKRKGTRPEDPERKKKFEEIDSTGNKYILLTVIFGIIGLIPPITPLGIIIFIVGGYFIYQEKQRAAKEKQKILDESYAKRKEYLQAAYQELNLNT